MKLVSNTVHQIVGFHFKVSFITLPKAKAVDVKFQSVTGLDVQIEKESLKEGGINNFEHSIPGRSKYTALTLKRGILTPKDSALTKWCQQAFQDRQIIPISGVDVELLNEKNEPMLKWQLAHVWPVSWKVGELNAERGEVLIETLELNYNHFKLVAIN